MAPLAVQAMGGGVKNGPHVCRSNYFRHLEVVPKVAGVQPQLFRQPVQDHVAVLELPDIVRKRIGQFAIHVCLVDQHVMALADLR